jgi:hypothetical protein
MKYKSKEEALDTILRFMFRGEDYLKPLDDGTQRNYPSQRDLESDFNSRHYGVADIKIIDPKNGELIRYDLSIEGFEPSILSTELDLPLSFLNPFLDTLTDDKMIYLDSKAQGWRLYKIAPKGMGYIRAGGYTETARKESISESKKAVIDNFRLFLDIVAVVVAFAAAAYTAYTDNKAEEYRERTELLEKRLDQINKQIAE